MVRFNSDGSADEILQGQGDVIDTVWANDDFLYSVVQDENFKSTLISLDLKTNKVDEIASLADIDVQSLSFHRSNILIGGETCRSLDSYDKEGGIQDLLDAFSESEVAYPIFAYDTEEREFKKLSIQGFFPSQF